MNEKTDFLYKKARKEDINGIYELEKKCFANPWSAFSFFIYICVYEDTEYIVVYDGDKVIGYGGMEILSDEAHITSICTHPDYRRKGIAQTVLYRMFSIMADRKVSSATLEVRVSNNSAIRLYEKFGFHISGKEKGYYPDNNEDAYIMEACIPSEFEPDKNN